MKPKKLNKGDKIGIIAPASPCYNKDLFMKGIKILNDLGFNIELGRSCFAREGFLAGDDFLRAEDFNNFFKRKDIDAIFCLRGGYGSIRILDKIDWDCVINNPKIFIGYSDITVLLNVIYDRTNIICFHGPMVGTGDLFNDINLNMLLDSLQGNLGGYKIKLKCINFGQAEGIIIGGNLSVLVSLIGTRYNINFKDKILFIEDINEEPYKIDRMLQTLKYCGTFDKLKAIILGQFTNCETLDEKSFTLHEVFINFFREINIPVFYGLEAGHGRIKMTIPIGIKVKIEDNHLTFLEEAVNYD
ncbi:MAG: LD-carboxypeptidase [Caloramator sp.]|nr:LD-carboxypeptidase [Caloramator sp.]